MLHIPTYILDSFDYFNVFLVCRGFVTWCAYARRNRTHPYNNVDECKDCKTRTMKSLWIARASSSRGVSPVIFSDKAMGWNEVNYLRYSQYVSCTYSRNELWSRGVRVSSSQRSRETALYARAGILRVRSPRELRNFFWLFFITTLNCVKRERRATHRRIFIICVALCKWTC